MRYHLILIAGFACSFATGCVNRPPIASVYIPPSDPQGEFELIALREIVRAGASVRPDSWNNLVDMIQHGVAELRSQDERGFGETQERYERAKRNLTRFVLHEINLAINENPSAPTLHEYTFGQTYSSICPSYPFC